MNVEIAQRLAARRKQAGLSQEALAEQLGVSRQAVSKWERSESSPDTDNLIALAQLYGLSLDELLYVEEEMRDDVAFEAADRATERQKSEKETDATAPESADSTRSEEPTQDAGRRSVGEDEAKADGKKSKVRIGLGGIHVLDGDDYVHVSWHDGVHVKDSKKGDEVHIGWDGVHVKEKNAPHENGDRANEAWTNTDGHPTGGNTDGYPTGGNADSHPTGECGGESSSWGKDGARGRARQVPEDDCFDTANDHDGSRGDASNEVIVDVDGVTVNGERFDSWRDAHARYGCGRSHDDRWYKPCGYTVNGERFSTMDDVRTKYGSEAGKSIPVKKHYLREFEKSWIKFPYPLVVVLVYALMGILNDAWGVGLFLFLTIPVYYTVGHAVGRRRIAPLVSGIYPVAVVAWFGYMAFLLNQPHPAWVAFLTIPLVEWLVHSLSRWWRRRKRAKEARKAAPFDVDAC